MICVAPGCGVPLVPATSWDKGYRPAGHSPHRGYGLCRAHYWRMRRRGTTDPAPYTPRPRPTAAPRSREEVLEDWAAIRDDVSSVAQAAERMGMSFSALDMALYRARKAGDPRAALPTNILPERTSAGRTTHPRRAAA